MKKEKVYISRDDGDCNICLWKKPNKGNWAPSQLEGCEVVNWQRQDLDNMDMYTVKDFKKKFGITIRSKTKKCVHLLSNLIHNEDYKLISNDPNRKK